VLRIGRGAAAPSIAGRTTMPDLDRIMATSDQVPAGFRGRIGPRAEIEPGSKEAGRLSIRTIFNKSGDAA
jgi:hypothetical protein